MHLAGKLMPGNKERDSLTKRDQKKKKKKERKKERKKRKVCTHSLSS
jgi:hypothetical protein